MKKNGFWLSGLMLLAMVLVFFTQSGHPQPSGKYHPHRPAGSHTSTVSILNPALFHRLNAVLEHGLIQSN